MKEKPQFLGDVAVRGIQEMHVAYLRHIGPYAGKGDLFQRLTGRLIAWAGPRGLACFPEAKLLRVYYDDPHITDSSKLRIDVCLTVPKGTAADGEIGSMTISGGRCAVGHFEIFPEQFPDAYDAIYGEWMRQSGYQPDDRPCYEVSLNDPSRNPEGKHVVEICVPVKPL